MSIHITLVFFSFNFKLEMIPKFSMICKAHLREFVSLVMRVVNHWQIVIFLPLESKGEMCLYNLVLVEFLKPVFLLVR